MWRYNNLLTRNLHSLAPDYCRPRRRIPIDELEGSLVFGLPVNRILKTLNAQACFTIIRFSNMMHSGLPGAVKLHARTASI